MTWVQGPPSAQQALDIFKGEWASVLPPPFDHLRAGTSLLFSPDHLKWGLEFLGGVSGKRVLELGPLEGGHSYVCDRMGAREVIAIEGNARAFLKCLIAKDLVGMPSVRFLHGDFMDYLRANEGERFDVSVASGVLYHMTNPAELIARLSAVSSRAYFWTHYYDADRMATNPRVVLRKVTPIASTHEGFGHRLYRHEYGDARAMAGFCGGRSKYSYWMSRQDIIDCLRYFGFKQVDIAFEQPDHVNGPCMSIAALKP